MPKTLSPTHKWIWLAVLLIGVVPPAGAQRPDAALPATGKTLDLEFAVRIALDQNPLNRAASEGITVAKEAVGEARAPFYPDLGLNAGYSRWERHAFLPNGIGRLGIPSLIGPTNDWFSGLATRYTLFDFGQRRAELKAAQARVLRSNRGLGFGAARSGLWWEGLSAIRVTCRGRLAPP